LQDLQVNYQQQEAAAKEVSRDSNSVFSKLVPARPSGKLSTTGGCS